MGQVTKLCLSCYLVLLSNVAKSGFNKTGPLLWPDQYLYFPPFPKDWDAADSWNLSTRKTWTHLRYIVNTMAVDALVMQGTRPSTGKGKNPITLHSGYHGCECPGDARSKGTNKQRQGPVHFIKSIPWMLMPWGWKEPGHQQTWFFLPNFFHYTWWGIWLL